MAEPGADILVVGTGELAAFAARAPLEAAGHRVRTAPDGQAALEELERQLADVVVTEWRMPRLDGVELCRIVRSEPALDPTHVIVMTTAEGLDRAVTALEAGADDYLTTPFEPAELLARVRNGRRAAQLRASEARLRALMANVPGAIYRCAPDRDWTMELISDEIERISGYPPEEFIDNAVRTYASVIHPDDREPVENAVFEACEAGRPFVLEYRVVRADGGITWVLERGQLVHGTNGRTWLDGAIFDINARREAEEQRRQKEAEQARVAELRASRARIIEATDTARRKIERDLHDGAQQEFIAVALSLRMVIDDLEKMAPDAAPLAREVLQELETAIEGLREMAQGIHPAVLCERGLVRAVEALARRMPMPVKLYEAPREPLPERVEAALYYVVSESLTNAYKHGGASRVTVGIGRRSGMGGGERRRPGRCGARRGVRAERPRRPRRGARRPSRGTQRPPRGHHRARRGPVRLVIAEDSLLLREGLVRLVREAGFDVVAEVGDADDLLRKVLAHKPDVAVVDVRMPPTHTDDGLRAALEIRRRTPHVGVLVLSEFIEEGYAQELLAQSAAGVGYLLKQRVVELERFVDALRRVGQGGSALDPEVVSQLLRGDSDEATSLADLTHRELEVLALMAEGRSNQGIAEDLVLTDRTVEKHVRGIFEKLGLEPEPREHRRVNAVLRYLRERQSV